MTTNIDRAAEVLIHWADSLGGMAAIERDYDGDLTGGAEALADAGLLAPDLPAPDQDGLWCPKVPTIEFVQSTGYTVHAVGGLARLDLTRDEALDFAAILTAAADYAERKQA